MLSGGAIVPLVYSDWIVQTAPLVDAAGELLAVLRATNPVLRREESYEPHTRRARFGGAQPLDVRLAVLVDARLIREQAHTLAADQVACCRSAAR